MPADLLTIEGPLNDSDQFGIIPEKVKYRKPRAGTGMVTEGSKIKAF